MDKLFNNKKIAVIFLILITGVSFFYRYHGIQHNDPFWIDEFSSVNQARYLIRYGLGVFNNPQIHIEFHNIFPNTLIALFLRLFGEHEWIARMPFILIGSFIPFMIFLLTNQLFGISTAISASLLVVFSYYQITWSRQARGYPLLQLLVLLLLYLYATYLKKGKLSKIEYIASLLTILVGITTHSFFFLLLIVISIHFAIFNRHKLSIFLRKPIVYIVSFIMLVIVAKTSIVNALITNFSAYTVGQYNNLWYYHSFLWREYGLITFLAIIGLLIGIFKQKRELSAVVLYIAIHLIFVSFFYGHYISKYLNPIFPLLLIGVAYAITSISKSFFSSSGRIAMISICLTLFIIANGYKFATKPKSFYSVNHDFREIALIDYHSIYYRIKEAINVENEKIAVVDTWSERLYWYLGQNYQPLYLLRWKTGGFAIVGQRIARSSFTYNEEHEKVMTNTNNVKLIEDVVDFKQMMKKYPKGFIFIDDATLPKDVVDYLEKYLKKELYLDHYKLDDNPYSIWPATLYSWGFN